jgi:hypothetical protein
MLLRDLVHRAQTEVCVHRAIALQSQAQCGAADAVHTLSSLESTSLLLKQAAFLANLGFFPVWKLHVVLSGAPRPLLHVGLREVERHPSRVDHSINLWRPRRNELLIGKLASRCPMQST